MLIQTFIKKSCPIHFHVKIWKWDHLILCQKTSKAMLHRMPTYLYLLVFLLWHRLEFESNQWICHSVAALSNLCDNDFKFAPMARLRTNHDVKGWLFSSAHHLHWPLLRTWALRTNVRLTYPTHTPADTFVVCLSQKHWRAFQLSNSQDRFDATPCGKAWIPLSFERLCWCLSRDMSVLRHLWQSSGAI